MRLFKGDGVEGMFEVGGGGGSFYF